jgi:hypothetical protein
MTGEELTTVVAPEDGRVSFSQRMHARRPANRETTHVGMELLPHESFAVIFGTSSLPRRTFASVPYALGEDPGVVMDEMGHSDPALAPGIYRQAMRRDGTERSKLGALVEGVEFRPIEADESQAAQTSGSARIQKIGESPGFTGVFATSRR